MNENENGEKLFNEAMAQSAFEQVAKTISMYYNALIEQGIPSDIAKELTCRYASQLMTNSFGMRGGNV